MSRAHAPSRQTLLIKFKRNASSHLQIIALALPSPASTTSPCGEITDTLRGCTMIRRVRHTNIWHSHLRRGCFRPMSFDSIYFCCLEERDMCIWQALARGNSRGVMEHAGYGNVGNGVALSGFICLSMRTVECLQGNGIYAYLM